MNGPAIGFDFDHTLGVDNGLERRAFALLLEEAGAPLADGDDAERQVVDEAIARFRAWTSTLGEAIDDVRAQLGKPWTLRAPADQRFRELCYHLVDEMVQPVDGARDVLAELEGAGIRYGILTNGWAPLQQKKIARALGAIHVPILVSETLGVQKPDPAAFAALCDALGSAPADTWYVGDNPAGDAVGARNAGLRAVWFDWEGVTYPAGAPRPDATIHRLHDLIGVVRGAQASATK